jgi:hypothetical protein
MRTLLLGLAAGLAAVPGAASACQTRFVGAYNAVISRQDAFASDGLRLNNVAAILQQDRANVHRYNRGDRGDVVDTMFRSAESRALIPRWLHEVTPGARAAILRGSAFVNVRVYEGCIDVRLAG